jgi:hypothetical protein
MRQGVDESGCDVFRDSIFGEADVGADILELEVRDEKLTGC